MVFYEHILRHMHILSRSYPTVLIVTDLLSDNFTAVLLRSMEDVVDGRNSELLVCIMATESKIVMSHSKPKPWLANMQKTSPHSVLHVTHLSRTFTGEFSFKNPKSNLLNMQRMDAHLVLPHATHPLLVLIALTNTTRGDRGGGCLFPKYFIGPESEHCLLFM